MKTNGGEIVRELQLRSVQTSTEDHGRYAKWPGVDLQFRDVDAWVDEVLDRGVQKTKDTERLLQIGPDIPFTLGNVFEYSQCLHVQFKLLV